MLPETHIREQGEETLERIISAAERMFAAHGYKGVAMSQLAEACAISKPALYYYFRDKQELYTEVLLHQLDRHSREFHHLLAGKSVREGLRALTDYLLASSAYDLNQMQADMRGELDDERRQLLNQIFLRDFFGPVKELFASGVASGELRPHSDAEVCAWMFMSVMSTVCNPNISLPPMVAGRTLADTIVETFMDGISNKQLLRKGLNRMSVQPNIAVPESGGLAYKWKVLISVVFGLFMVILDATVINVALKTLQSEFHANTNEVQWVISIYTLAVGIATPLSGFLGDRFGAKRIYLLGLALFVVGSLLCGISTALPALPGATGNLILLIIFRAVQGIGGGIALPLGTAMLFGSFERKEQGLAFGIFGIVLVFAPAIGPLLGGWLVDQNLWQWIFYINLPVGALGLTLGTLWLKQQRSPRKPKADLLGILFSSIGFGSILYGASSAGEQGVGWGDLRTLSAFAVGAAGLIAFAITELRVAEPLLDLRLFKIRNFLIANIVGWVGVIALFGAEFLLPLYLQILRGKSAFDTGLVLLPLAIAAGFSIPISGFIADRIGPRVLVVLGFAILAFNTWQLAQIDLNTDIGFISFLLVIRGLALGLVIQNTNVAALRDVPLRQLARGTSLVNSTQQIMQSVGVAALATVLTSAITVQIPQQFATASSGSFDLSKLPPVAQQAYHQFQNQYIDGLHAAYTITMVIAIVTTLLAAMLPGWPGKYEQHVQNASPATEESAQPALVALAHRAYRSIN